MKTCIYCMGLALALPFLALTQTPANDGLVSPEVQTDRSVTFRVRAPKANEVTLYGDWMPVGKPEPMSKGGDGVWSIHTGPLEANVHLYWFNLDGVAVADPINPVIKVRQRTSASLVEVPAQQPAAWELHDVPHGTVVTEWRKSEVLQRTERIICRRGMRSRPRVIRCSIWFMAAATFLNPGLPRATRITFWITGVQIR
jgi:hypothetical protein